MFYDNLKAICDKKGLKITPIVAECGGAKGSITNWRNGATPNSDIVIRLAERLDVTTDSLLLGSDKCTFSEEQEELLLHFNSLSSVDKGKVIGKAETLAELAAERTAKKRAAEQTKKPIKIAEPAADELPDDEPEELKLVIPYFDYPASAGTGLFLDETTAEELTVKATPDAYSADFAIPIDGNSMEPDFSSGDIVLVKSCPNIPEGKIGIFVLDGDVYIKEYGGDCLISHNSEYKPIMLKKHSVSICLGRVLGKAEVV